MEDCQAGSRHGEARDGFGCSITICLGFPDFMHVLHFQVVASSPWVLYRSEDGKDMEVRNESELSRPGFSTGRLRDPVQFQHSELYLASHTTHSYAMPSPLDLPESSTPSQPSTPDAQAAQRLAIEYDQAAATPAVGLADDKEEVHSLDVGGGNVVKLDKLGPMIINSDGVSIGVCLSMSWLCSM